MAAITGGVTEESAPKTAETQEAPAAVAEPPRSEPIITAPRGNQQIEALDVQRGEDKLFRIVGN
jgi:hypothetical protein